MANIKIAQLTNKTTLADTDIIIVESATATEKMTVANLKLALGAVVESGSNTNGSYLKYADGTMICYKTIESLSLSVGPAATYESGLFPFPQNFFYPPFADCNGYVTNNFGGVSNIVLVDARPTVSAATQNWKFSFYNGSGFAVDRILGVSFYAIGRWKA